MRHSRSKRKNLKKNLLDYAFFYLRFRDRTEEEMRRYLEKKAKIQNIDTESISHTLNKLKEQDYLNDGRFALQYITARGKNRPRSQSALRYELIHKGISEDVVNAALSDASLDETALAKATLQRVWSRYHHLDTETMRQRLIPFLRRRGFAFSVIAEVLRDKEEEEKKRQG